MIFGHQDSQNGASDDQQPAGMPMGGSFIVGAQPADGTQSVSPSTSPVTDAGDSPQTTMIQPPQPDAVSLSDESAFDSSESIMQPDTSEEDSQPAAVVPADDTPVDEADDGVAVTAPNADLLVLKQQALSDLGPLVSQLDQTPEERFRTTMMMLQSTDNQALIKDAYAAAQAIEDEKIRAQALLDVINEINYFTQQSAKD